MKQDRQLSLEILLMQPKEFPIELLSVLNKFFSSRNNIQKAYFSIVQFSNSLDSVDFLIAIEANTDVAGEIDKVKKYIPNYMCDMKKMKVVVVDAEQQPFNNYFSKIKPFYEVDN